MTEDIRTHDDEPAGRRRSGGGVGALVLVAALGVGIGLLAAPEKGVKTRRRLRKRMAKLGTGLGEGLEGVQELGGRARERMRARMAAMRRREEELEDDLDEEEEEDDDEAEGGRSTFGTLAALAAGAAASYFLASERAAPARTRVRETAETVRRRAGDRWQQYQQSRGDGFGRRAGDAPETPGQVRPSDEPPLGS